MFTSAERDRLREQLLARAQADDAIVGAAFTGSHATGDGDRWSGTDLVLAVHGDLGTVLERWTRWLYDELGAVHHWDLPAGSQDRACVRTAQLAGDRPDLRATGGVRPAWPAMADGLRSAAAALPSARVRPALLEPMLAELAAPGEVR